MSSQFKLAVALATYNGEKFVNEQLLSIKNQTLKIDEVVICDDASTDNTVKIVEDFINKNNLNWKLIINKKNIGYKLNFKKCLSEVSADLTFLCDQDDIWLPKKVEEIVKVFSNYSDCVGVNSAYTCIDASGSNIESKKLDSPKNIIKISAEQVIKQNVAPGCTSCYKKSVINKYLETTDSVLPHDWELNILAAAQNGLYLFNKELTEYRLHDSNAIGLEMKGDFSVKLKGSEEKRKEILEIQGKRAEYLKKINKNAFADNFDNFINNRRLAVYDKKVFPAFKNILKVYRLKGLESVSYKSAVGDIIFALKGKGKK